MKRFFKLVGPLSRRLCAIAFIAVIGFSITGCIDEGSTTENLLKAGSVTVLNLPSDYQITSCQVFNNPSIEWKVVNQGSIFMYPQGDTSSTLIGQKFNVSIDPDTNISPYAYNEVGIVTPTPTEIGVTAGKSDFTYTGNASVWLGISTNENKSIGDFGINNVAFSNGHATIDYAAFPNFALPQTNGKFTLTNASDYNDKYVILFGTFGNVSSPGALYGFNDATSVTALKGFKIANGEVEMPLYQITFGDNKFTAFNHTGDVISIVLIILDNENFNYTDYAANQTNYKYLLYSTTTSNGISFTNGVGSADASNGSKFPTTGW